MEVLLCILLLVISLGTIVYLRRKQPKERTMTRMELEAKREGEERALRVLAVEMGMTLETFQSLSEWALEDRESPVPWAFADYFKARKPSEVEVAPLDEILKRFGNQSEATVLALYRGAKLTPDATLRRQWDQVVRDRS